MTEVLRILAQNPGPFTLSGTNTWLVGRDPVWVIDPGPALEAHVEAVARAVAARGSAGGIAVTHDHPDHVEAVPGLAARLGGPPVAAARFEGADVRLSYAQSFCHALFKRRAAGRVEETSNADDELRSYIERTVPVPNVVAPTSDARW